MFKGRNYLQPFYLSLCLTIGVLIGWAVSAKTGSSTELQSTSRRLTRILNIIEQEYVDTVDMDMIVEHGIHQILEKLDPHTSYVPASEQAFVQSHLEADFEGIGIEFDVIFDTLYVIDPIDGGPSEKAGLLPGDKIVSVDGKNIAGKELATMEIVALLRGEKGTSVNLGILRSGQEITSYTIVRDKIPTYSVDAGFMLNSATGYIKINRFAEQTYDEFKTKLKLLNKAGMETLILDLRDNGGGYMSMAISIADEFLPSGRKIVFTDGKNDKYDETHYATSFGNFEKGALIVLINENSASASEIVAGAIQDNDRGLIVGRRSFGKGLVQIPKILEDGSELRLTISRYYTPSGRCIQKSYDKIENYHLDYSQRAKNGELYYQDSIKHLDSLSYKTLAGRTVYGGGGIIPDIFIPVDTSENSAFLNQLWQKNVLRTMAIDYINALRDKYNDVPFSAYSGNYEIDDNTIQDLLRRSQEKGIKYKKSDVTKSLGLIKIYLKALIAKGLYDSETYYRIYSQRDHFILEALTLTDSAKVVAQKHQKI